MICKSCEKRKIMAHFSAGKCKICNKNIFVSIIPRPKICKECSDGGNVCEYCEKKIEDTKGV